MFKRLGVGPGCSLTGGLTALCIPGIVVLMRYGKALRSRSTFASS